MSTSMSTATSPQPCRSPRPAAASSGTCPFELRCGISSPGLNTVSLEAILMTKEDELCVPGTTAGVPDRVSLSSIPANSTCPISPGSDSGPISPRWQAPAIPTAALTHADAALHRPHRCGHSFGNRHIAWPGWHLSRDVRSTLSPQRPQAAIGERDAIFVGSISQMPQGVLSQLNIATTSQATWRPLAATQTTPSRDQR
jgi:hypothetical protein